MARNLKRILKHKPLADIGFIGYPPIEFGWIASRWLKSRKIPYIIDIKDEWPHIILREVPKRLRPLAKIVLVPYFLMMKYSFNNAAGMTSTTNEFLEWSLSQVNKEKSKFDFALPTTSSNLQFTDIELHEARLFWDSLGISENPSNRIFFVGTINEVYDFKPLLYAAENNRIEIIIAGDGPQRENLLNLAKKLSNVYLPGWITTVQAAVLAERSILAIAPFHQRSDFDMNVTNKFYDAMRLGKPMLTTTDGVAGKLLLENGMGLIYRNKPIDSLNHLLNDLFSNRKKISEMSINAAKIYQDRFNASMVYSNAVQKLEDLKECYESERQS
jgi:glycosyltransferase involved in cell wall biosynthesis